VEDATGASMGFYRVDAIAEPFHLFAAARVEQMNDGGRGGAGFRDAEKAVPEGRERYRGRTDTGFADLHVQAVEAVRTHFQQAIRVDFNAAVRRLEGLVLDLLCEGFLFDAVCIEQQRAHRRGADVQAGDKDCGRQTSL
jgi:hypothetical protein